MLRKSEGFLFTHEVLRSTYFEVLRSRVPTPKYYDIMMGLRVELKIKKTERRKEIVYEVKMS